MNIPFILVDGASESAAAIKKLLPDAIETTWPRIGGALANARTNPPSGGRKLSVFAAYENKTLGEKLGIKPRTIVG